MTELKEVFVVTRGEYSDYGIDCIFTDKVKAEKYAELKNNNDNDGWYGVETYPLDKIDVSQATVIKVHASKEMYEDDYEFEYQIVNVVDNEDSDNVTYISNYEYTYGSKSSSIELVRKVKGSTNEEYIVKKYKKVIEDLFFKIESNWEFYKTREGKQELQTPLEKEVDSIME